MTTEATDKETQPAVASADEVVGASQSSSQSTDDSVTTSQGTESSDVQEAKESEETAAAKDQPDVEMDEAKDEAESKETPQDVQMEPAAEEKTEENEEEEPTANSVEKADDIDNTPSDEKAVETGDVEMATVDEAAREAKSESNGAAGKEVNAEKCVADSETLKESKETDAEVKVSIPKRKEQMPIPESNNEVAAPEEPAAKKQKVDRVNSKAPEKEATTTAAEAEEASPSVMLSRDDMAKLEEDSGRLKFDVITNDGTDEHMIQLTTLKNIFAKQLPKMPKEYIVRLVFDKNHRSMLLLKNGTHVIGGICYRPFEKNQFAEIAFCAINASDQVKGYGTRLMNHLKEYVKTKNITHFLTYADNYAIGYFKKQGFTKSVSMARPNWYGYIKDYDGGTLMECTIHTQINYLRITSMIHRQRKVIQDKIQERSRAKVVYPGLTQFAEGRLMDIYMVPGVKEAGWSQATIRNNRIGTRDQGSLKSQLSQLLKAVSSHRSAWPFHEPVDTTLVVDYLEHIKDPVDLQLISKRIDSGVYLSKSALKTDLERMCDNCTTYNTPDTNYYKAAIDLKEFIQSRIQIRDHN